MGLKRETDGMSTEVKQLQILIEDVQTLVKVPLREVCDSEVNLQAVAGTMRPKPSAGGVECFRTQDLACNAEGYSHALPLAKVHDDLSANAAQELSEELRSEL